MSPREPDTAADVARAFRVALEARNLDAAVALLTDDVVFRSPVVFEPYRGRDAVKEILYAVSEVLDEWRCVREIGAPGGSDHAIVFRARIGDRQIEGCDFLHLDEHGSIDEFYVMVRPLSGALALAETMKALLERRA
jgi:nuclear transport factor 2 (NTF2) superfamily protein